VLVTQGWPKLVVKVFEHHDYIGSNTFLAYGICSIPTTSGTHMLQCTTWRANDRMTWLKDELSGFFTNRTTELVGACHIRPPPRRPRSDSASVSVSCVTTYVVRHS
jgi:hypothetical protein